MSGVLQRQTNTCRIVQVKTKNLTLKEANLQIKGMFSIFERSNKLLLKYTFALNEAQCFSCLSHLDLCYSGSGSLLFASLPSDRAGLCMPQYTICKRADRSVCCSVSVITSLRFLTGCGSWKQWIIVFHHQHHCHHHHHPRHEQLAASWILIHSIQTQPNLTWSYMSGQCLPAPFTELKSKTGILNSYLIFFFEV